MTKKVTMIAEADLDKQTVTISEENKVGSMFLLTPQEVTISAKQIQNLIFRKSKNSNYPMFCTGFQDNQEWYGDRPDDGIWINPFENMQKYQRTGETDVRYTSEPSGDKPNRLILKETSIGAQIIVESKNDDLGSLPQLLYIHYNGIYLSHLGLWKALNDGSFYQQYSSTVLSFKSSAILEFIYNELRYRVTLPKIADEGGAGTFAIEFDKNNQFYDAIINEDSFILLGGGDYLGGDYDV